MFKMFSFAALPGGPYEFWNESAGLFYRDELHKKAHPGIAFPSLEKLVQKSRFEMCFVLGAKHVSNPE